MVNSNKTKENAKGRIYLTKAWVGKKVKTILISSLIVMGMVVITQQQAKAELTFKQKLETDNIARHSKINLDLCIRVLIGDTSDKRIDLFTMNSSKALSDCDDDVINTTGWCKSVGEDADEFRKSGICEDPGLQRYIDNRNLWNRID